MREDSTRLDYARPFNVPPYDPKAIVRAYIDACKAGDRPSCYVGLSVASSNSDEFIALEPLVDANCRAGDTMSCRALPPSNVVDLRFPDSPGAAGRSEACNDLERKDCDQSALHGECERGFPASCDLEISRNGSQSSPALQQRRTSLAVAGCAAGVGSECKYVVSSGDADLELAALERSCDLLPVNCHTVAERYLAKKQPVAARDLMERLCQFAPGAETACAELGAMYLAHKLEEPLPGRGQALVDWACAEIPKRYSPEMVNKEDCKLARLR
jgi:hypothetical protein